MAIETNLNVTPYFDDFDEEKNYHRILFRPGVALQARELTQLQTILQTQVERFGDNVYVKGTIIDGCNIYPDYGYNYIKINDLQEDGQPVSLGSYYDQLLIEESSNLQALIINTVAGLQSQNPDLNTVYLKYINTGGAGQKVFSNNQVIKVFNVNRTIEEIIITAGGATYSNSDSVVITGTTGSGAIATITTNGDGKIIDVSLINKGTSYTTIPSVTITTSTGAGAVLTAVNYIAQIRVADSTYTAPVGRGAAVKTDRGIIYQKGNFIRVTPQTVILEKYSPVANNKSVGFVTSEAIVNSNVDASLLDLATGSPNFAAPGANRLQLTPTLLVVNTEIGAANNEFLPLLEFQDGNIVRNRDVTQFNSINKELARRTFEESGDYVLDTFRLDTSTVGGSNTHFNLILSPGTAYVKGERISLLNNTRTPVRKGTDSSNAVNQTINTQYGSYVLVKELSGQFEIKNGTQVNLRSTAGTDITDNSGGTPTTPGSVIGTALVRSLEYSSGTPGTPDCVYKLYIFNVVMSSGKSFKDVRCITVNATAIADVVLTNGFAELQDLQNDTLVFNTGTFAVKELTSEKFIFRTSTTATLAQATGNVTVSFSGANILPYGIGSLSDADKQQFIIVPQASFRYSSNVAGTVGASTTQTNVTGTGTVFTTALRVGDYISIGGGVPQRVSFIYNDQLLSLSSNAAVAAVANSIHIAFPAFAPINMNRSGSPARAISADSTTQLTVSVGAAINVATSFTMYHNLENFEPAVRAKTVNNPVYVKISTDKLASTVTGPWCLGIPDVFSLEAVYVGAGNSYSESTTNYVDEFILQSGQKDNFYGLSYIAKKPGSTLSLSASSSLAVKVKSFSHGTGKYLSTESYPLDDTTTTLPSNKIRTETIPIFISPTSGEALSLRDALDFRPIVANTALLSSTLDVASIDPPTTETLVSGEKFFPCPSRSFETTIESYMARVDRVVITTAGRVRTIEGIPSNTPQPPPPEADTMSIGVVSIAPFPSLTSKVAATAKRSDLKNTVTLSQTRRYTMNDINSLEKRIQRLEYYTLLNTIEADTKNLTLPGEANTSLERFKNGFFVDSFNDYQISNINDGEYKALINTDESKLTPQQELISVDLRYSTAGSGTTKLGDLVTLPYTTTSFVSQPHANKERTLVTGFWSFAGKMIVIPRVDNFFDTDVVSTSVIDINIADPINALTNSVNDALGKLNLTPNNIKVSSGGVNQTTVVTRPNQFITTTTQNYSETLTTTKTDTFQKIAPAPTITSTQDVGNFLKSVQVNPYIREQRIAIHTAGLRPGAQHYVFFDGVDVTSYCVPATITDPNNATLNSFLPIYNKGSSPALMADANGVLALLVYLPGDTFTTGEKEFLVMDVSSLASESGATSKSSGKFSSFTLSGTSGAISTSTKSFNLAQKDAFAVSTYQDTQVINQTTNKWAVATTVDLTPPAPATDPLAQTFYVHSQDSSEFMHLTAIEVFFKQKDTTKGVTLDLREVSDEGQIRPFIVPFGTVYKPSANVSVSNNASTGTMFNFPSPVQVRTGREYAIVLTPDASSPDYRVWTAIPGLPDVLDTTKTPNKTWGEGTMFYSTSNRSFTAVQDEDIKFKVYRAEFTGTSGTLVMTNDDTEYLTIANNSGSFTGGEEVAQLANSYLNSTITTNTTSSVITTGSSLSSVLAANDTILIVYGTANSVGTGTVKSSTITITNATSTSTAFNTKYANGDFIRIGDEVRQVITVTNDNLLTIDAPLNTAAVTAAHYSVDEKFDILRIQSANSTAITVNRPPEYTVSASLAGSIQRVVSGRVGYYNSTKGKLHLKDSNASNSIFKIFVANSTYNALVVGDNSDASAKVTSIDNLDVAAFNPFITNIVTPGTSITPSLTVTKFTGGTENLSYLLNGKTYIKINDTGLVKSKSNEIAGATLTKSLSTTLTLETSYTTTSPVVDVSPASLVFSKYLINNSNADENTRYGNASCKYISKRLVLADGLDAEDIKVFISAYKPSGTDIYVYAKILNASDQDGFENKDWSLLDQVTSPTLFSASLDENDIREYEYTFKYTPTVTVLPGFGTANTGNTTIVGSNTNFSSSLTANDIVKIVRTSSTNDYFISPVASIGSDTSLVLENPVTFASTSSGDVTNGVTIEKVTSTKQAFKYNQNSNIVRYYTNNQEAMDSYKYMALKIVLVSDNTYLVPKLDDARAIAVSV